MKTVLAVCKNVGGANALLPVMDLLKANYRIRWIVQDDGRAKDVLKSLGYEFDLFLSVERVYKEDIIAIVSGMCATVGQALSRHFKGLYPVITIQDQWGAYLGDVWSDPEHRPDYILVNDQLDKDIVLKTWFPYESKKVVITGYPALDKYANLDVQSVRKRVKNVLSIKDNRPVVLFTGQWWHRGHAIGELVKALNEIKLDVYLIARPHPAMKDNASEEIPLWDRALTEFHSGTLIDSSCCDTFDIITASDLVISMYSATLQEAATIKIPNIAILYLNQGMKKYIEVTRMDNYPMVSLGCTAKAGNYEELVRLLKTALTSDLGLRPAQEEAFSLDGKNALRAADFISSLVT